MKPRILPMGSTLHMHQPMLLQGIGSSKQWTANGKNTTSLRMVQYIVETAHAFYLLIPQGAYRGWRQISRNEVSYVQCPPPDDVLALVAAHEEALVKEAEAKATAEAEAVKSATTGADYEEQKSPPAAA